MYMGNLTNRPSSIIINQRKFIPYEVIALNTGLVQIAQNIVKAVSKTFPFSISLSDSDGYIIGDTDKDRIGKFHPVSKKVIESNCFISYSETDVLEFDNVLPGVAVPLNFQHQTIGVLGIIGPPEIVKPHAELAKHYVELMWQETYYRQLEDLEGKVADAYLQYILLNDSVDNARTADYCKALHLNMSAKTFCVIVDLRTYLVNEFTDRTFSLTKNNLKELLFSEIRQHFRTGQIMNMSFLNAEKIVLLMAVSSAEEYFIFMESFQETSNKMLTRLEEQHIPHVVIAAGQLTSSVLTIAESYEEAEQLIRQAEQINGNRRILSYYDWNILIDLLPFNIESAFNDRVYTSFIHVLESETYKEVIRSFIAYCESGMNMTEAAKTLYVHRNTVIYRLKKLEELISIDLKDFQHCSLLYLIVKKPPKVVSASI